jgi:nucleotide-binding universal stress UspA family protein
MIIIKKILVPTDLDDSSVSAIGYALSLAKILGAEVGVLNVLPHKAIKEDLAPVFVTEELMEPGALTSPLRATDSDSILERKQRIIRDFLQERISSELLKNVKIATLVRFGKPAKEIVAAAKEEQSDLIVMDRRSGLFLRGHITDQIAQQASCPVLSIQGSAEIRTEQNERVPISLMNNWAA